MRLEEDSLHLPEFAERLGERNDYQKQLQNECQRDQCGARDGVGKVADHDARYIAGSPA